MEEDLSVDEVDLRSIVRLLGEVAALPGDLLAKKCHLLDGLCRLVGASEWRWALFAEAGDPEAPRCLGALRRKLDEGGALAIPMEESLASDDLLPPSQESPQVMLSRRSIGRQTQSRIALCRCLTDSSYTQRESHLASLVLERIPWLHLQEWEDSAPGLQLPPRKRLVLDHLLLGLGRKEIAACMKISEGTVSGYIREIYEQLGVNSQAELISIRHRLLND